MKQNKKFSRVLGVLLLVTLIVTSFCACGSTPSAVTKNEIKKYQKEDTCKAAIAKELKKSIAEDQKLGKEETDLFYKKNIKETGLEDNLAKIISDFKFETKDEKIKGNKATVTVTVTTKKYGEAFAKSLDKGLDDFLGDLFAKMMTGEEVKEDEVAKGMYKVIANSLNDSIENAKGTYKGHFDIKLKKADGKWVVDEDSNNDSEVFNVITGGIFDSLNQMSGGEDLSAAPESEDEKSESEGDKKADAETEETANTEKASK